MLLAIAALLIQPQVVPQLAFSAEKAALIVPANPEVSSTTGNAENSMPSASVRDSATGQPAANESSALPEAPVPAPAVISSAPNAFIRSVKPNTVSVNALREENRRNIRIWKGLTLASHGAATFDAWTTRRAISTYGAQELNPLMKPFASNASIYAAIQVIPAFMDYAGRRMMYSRHSWIRHSWWIPQSASFAGSLFCGAHNLTVH